MTTNRSIVITLACLGVLSLTDCAAPVAQTTPAEAAEPASQGTRLFIVGNGVRLRAGPGTDHEIVGQLNRGDPVTVLFGSGAWCAIQAEMDTVWVHANLVGSQTEAQSR